MRLKIARGGVLLLDRTLPETDSEPSSQGAGAGRSSLHVVDLDRDGEPEVLVDLSTGGVRCCFFTYAYRYRDGSYARTRIEWGRASYRVADFDRDGVAELVTGDERFAEEFGPAAFSPGPARVVHFRRGKLVDVTRDYLGPVADQAADLWQAYHDARENGIPDLRGLFAAYVADLYLLGRGEQGWERLLETYRAGDLAQGVTPPPLGRAYLAKLRRFLAAAGYIRDPLPALPPLDWETAAVEVAMPVFSPQETFGLRLRQVVTRRTTCNEQPSEELDAAFRPGSGGRSLRITEGKPLFCADVGDAPLLARPSVHGVRGRLWALCEGEGCGQASSYLLMWYEQGVQLVLIATGFSREELLGIARSMAPVA